MGKLSLFAVLFACTVGACAAKQDEPADAPPGEYAPCDALYPTCSPAHDRARDCEKAVCSFFIETRSESFSAAAVACARRMSPCADEFASCVDDETMKVTHTRDLDAIKQAFCSKCPTELGACDAFYTAGLTPADTLGGAGLPLLSLEGNVAGGVYASCSSKLGSADPADPCGVGAFAKCARDEAVRFSKPAGCN